MMATAIFWGTANHIIITIDLFSMISIVYKLSILADQTENKDNGDGGETIESGGINSSW